MVDYTPTHNLPYPDGSDSVRPQLRDFRELAQHTATALTSVLTQASSAALAPRYEGNLNDVETGSIRTVVPANVTNAPPGALTGILHSWLDGSLRLQMYYEMGSAGRIWRRYNVGPWSRVDAGSVREARALTESDHLDSLTTPGLYSIIGGIATAVGAPEPGVQNVEVMPLGPGLTGQFVYTGSVHGAGPRVWYRHSLTGGWSRWHGAAGNTPGTADLIHLQDAPGHAGMAIKINHYGNGSGDPNGQTYGIDIANWPDAHQAIVIHQYSDAREALRIDNTDKNSGIYINNTQNLGRNPDGTGQGAPFITLHPYNMSNFVDKAHLMDDLTFANETNKTWAFQSDTGPIVEFKNAAGVVVGYIDQAGNYVKGTP